MSYCFVTVVDRRKGNGKGRTEVRAGALDLNRSSMQFNQMFDERQTEAQPAVTPCSRGILLRETLEDIGQEIGDHALARIAHYQPHTRLHPLALDFNESAIRREFDGVGQEIPDQPAGDLDQRRR